jgi:chromosome partitioning protein
LIPVETGFFALRGAEKQWNTIQRIISHIDRPIACHLLATLHKSQSKLACNILAALRRQFAGQIMPVVIHEHEELRAAASFGQPVIEYAPESTATSDYAALVDWLEQHAAHSRPHIEVLTRDCVTSATLATVKSGLLEHGAPIALPGRLEAVSAVRASHTNSPAPSPAHAVPARPIVSRAAEMARRVQDFAARSEQQTAETTSLAHDEPANTKEPPAAAIATSAIAGVIQTVRGVRIKQHETHAALMVADADTAPMVDAGVPPPPPPDHLLGVRQTAGGELVVQSGDCGRQVCIAGDFNDWSATATPMRRNTEVGVHEALVPLTAGKYQYRLVVDGRWQPDPHNELRQINDYGELNSMVEVR